MQTGSDPITVALSGADTEILPPNLTRIGLLIGPNTAQAIWLGFGSPAVANNGFTIPVAATPFSIEGPAWAELLHKSIHAVAAGACTITFAEVVGITLDRQPEKCGYCTEQEFIGKPSHAGVPIALEPIFAPPDFSGGYDPNCEY